MAVTPCDQVLGLEALAVPAPQSRNTGRRRRTGTLPRNRTRRRLIAPIGILWFHEAASPLRGLFIAIILVGAVGLNLTTRSH